MILNLKNTDRTDSWKDQVMLKPKLEREYVYVA